MKKIIKPFVISFGLSSIFIIYVMAINAEQLYRDVEQHYTSEPVIHDFGPDTEEVTFKTTERRLDKKVEEDLATYLVLKQLGYSDAEAEIATIKSIGN